jgi:hypothetical protein
MSGPTRSRAAALVVVGALSGCAALPPPYRPRLVARQELVLSYDGRFELVAGGRRVARGLAWSGLEEFVRCVPDAAAHAARAETAGRAAVAFTALGVGLGAGSLASLAGFAVNDGKDLAAWLGIGVGVAALGTVFAGLSRLEKNTANGSAVDAMNVYNDAVGSRGGSCSDGPTPAPAP